jgi:hypothetical protein
VYYNGSKCPLLTALFLSSSLRQVTFLPEGQNCLEGQNCSGVKIVCEAKMFGGSTILGVNIFGDKHFLGVTILAGAKKC